MTKQQEQDIRKYIVVYRLVNRSGRIQFGQDAYLQRNGNVYGYFVRGQLVGNFDAITGHPVSLKTQFKIQLPKAA
jgi:hypothetical protein